MISTSLARFSDIVGMFGVIIVLIAYFLLSINKWSAHSMIYQFCNFLGALFILFSLLFDFNLASFSIEAAWVLISLVGMYRIQWIRKKNSVKTSKIKPYLFE